MADRFIAVSGNIGVGKTSLVSYMEQTWGLQPVYEPNDDNPYLDDFYKDMDEWAFHSQMWFLSKKFRLHQDLDARPGVLVQDRTIYEDAEIFATALHQGRQISKRDWETYQELYQAMKNSLRPPDLMIYLRCPVRTIRKRIKQRGRESEQNIPVSYLRRLNRLYEDWMSGWDASPILVWESDKMDYLSDMVDRLEFHKAMKPFVGEP
ncbi:MAG: deoxynucleoside kinase [Rhodobacterales bacterium]|nr:deoxynucleoside kinase [Rhodobacterales bacterium]